ncbi:MAG: sulfatase-like hydrolase/transferase, partial [Chloroflexi bacterium]|nr:sulfatase-like hydrolase/transferase [Chloroflexota bacterium]
PHPPFNPPQHYRDRFHPSAVNPPLFRDTDLAQQSKLAGIDFQSQARHPDRLDINSPILPQSPQPSLIEAKTPGARDARTLIAAYYAMIKLIDDQIGRIMTALEESGQRDNTLIIFTSDHGDMLGDHGLIQKGCRFYEGLVRVPLIMAWRGRFAAGLRSQALVELTDIVPTLLDICGLAISPYLTGKSLLPILTAAKDPDQHRDMVRSEYIDALDLPGRSAATMQFDGRYKFIRYHNHDRGELYDLQSDPGEFDDLWESPAHQALKLELALRSLDAAVMSQYHGPPRIGPM